MSTKEELHAELDELKVVLKDLKADLFYLQDGATSIEARRIGEDGYLKIEEALS